MGGSRSGRWPSGEPIAHLGAGRTEIQCLAFGRDPVLKTSRDPKPKARGARLAAGRR